ncbi:hypothetical protein AOXY_G701 [Acipenser oxyrinchus oxyrinchus]|uniref:Uncharacterized protein n=1 Tax=Acipenser oxyrinchus oxyrinchus TaxID=40147 RepID=A0AAD8GJR7_ACIOX|nr:hypothetical protein AOXY_G701 [Acipenser oxyrinchus oxyrinchus]
MVSMETGTHNPLRGVLRGKRWRIGVYREFPDSGYKKVDGFLKCWCKSTTTQNRRDHKERRSFRTLF